MTTEHQHKDDQQRCAEQEVIDKVGKEGTVKTHGGETSLGTTPIGVGSVEPVGGHREASDRIMGERDSGDDRGKERANRETK
jgi:hypothetical protein